MYIPALRVPRHAALIALSEQSTSKGGYWIQGFSGFVYPGQGFA